MLCPDPYGRSRSIRFLIQMLSFFLANHCYSSILPDKFPLNYKYVQGIQKQGAGSTGRI